MRVDSIKSGQCDNTKHVYDFVWCLVVERNQTFCYKTYMDKLDGMSLEVSIKQF